MASSGEARRREREVEVSSVEITAFCHATEECSRVESSIRNLLPEDIRTKLELAVREERGYYGNPIVILSLVVRDPLLASSIVKYVASKLEDSEKRLLRITSRLRFDPREKRFIIRFSKQGLYMNKLQLVDSDDVVKLTIHLKNVKSYRDLEEFLARSSLIS